MIFKPDLTKAQQAIFSRKTKKLQHHILLFSSIPLKNCMFHKHPGLTLDLKFNLLEQDFRLGSTLYPAKRMHDSSEIKPNGFRLSWRLTCHQHCAWSSKSVPRTYLDRYAWDVYLDLDGSSDGCQTGDTILIHLPSHVRSSKV